MRKKHGNFPLRIQGQEHLRPRWWRHHSSCESWGTVVDGYKTREMRTFWVMYGVEGCQRYVRLHHVNWGRMLFIYVHIINNCSMLRKLVCLSLDSFQAWYERSFGIWSMLHSLQRGWLSRLSRRPFWTKLHPRIRGSPTTDLFVYLKKGTWLNKRIFWVWPPPSK